MDVLAVCGHRCIGYWSDCRGHFRRANLGRYSKAVGDGQDAEKRAEAANVQAWLTKPRDDVAVYVRNGNSGPVFDVRVEVVAVTQATTNPKVATTLTFPILPPALTEPNKELRQYLPPSDHLPDGYNVVRDKREPTVASNEDWKVWDGQSGSTGLAVSLSFRDSIGNHWQRDSHGKLSQIGA